MTENLLEKDLRFLRFHALVSGLLSVVASFILFAAHFPYARLLSGLSILAACVYLTYFSVFNLVPARVFRRFSVGISQVGVLIITAAIWFTGGIVSPFIFLYFALLLSESMYGLENPITVPLSLAGYLLTAACHFWGFGPATCQWSEAIYRSPLGVVLILLLTSGYMLMTRGITARILANLRARIEREEGQKAGLLKRFSELDASAQIGALAHRIAHDLRAPLSSISGYVQMEMAKPQPPDAADALKDLDSTVNSMAESLQCITRFGKNSPAPAEKILLPEFFRQLLAIAAFAPNARGVKFVKNYQETMAAEVLASRADLQQAYFNLVKNSLEATRDNATGRSIEITIRRADKDIEIVVADNGPGMTSEVLKTLFRKSITTKADGTGVGLVITRDLLLRNDGCIEFHNRAEGGLEAVTRLPAA